MNKKMDKAYASYKRELNYRRLKGNVVRVIDRKAFEEVYSDYQYVHQLKGKQKESIIKEVVRDSIVLTSRKAKSLARAVSKKVHKAVFTGDIQKLLSIEDKQGKYAYTNDYEASADYDEADDFTGAARNTRIGEIANELDLTSAGGRTTVWEMCFALAEGSYAEAGEMYDEWVS